MKHSQAELIAKMTDEQLRVQVYLTQGILLLISCALGWFLYDTFEYFINLFKWNISEIFLIGVLPGFLVVAVDISMYQFVPKKYWDDGGINEKIFRSSTVFQIFLLTVVVAISEEILFRGVLQPTIGYITTSLFFAIIHIRYLFKPVLFIGVVALSFYIGWLFELTNNLLVTITTHFIIDFGLALYIRFLGGK
ncbi:CAAX amino protease [Paraliobacillus quinghaiensis]|uniref:CAAX amino protease n=1 Tax=Paraliobacillus quinghaiensis TaxID=470815 RepID=A0A917WR50_9BACI|nr:CPBP family intramembrane glutamic endopeptidase [Paraliobacillus quinghaiensis]GGM22659.1 CAAX amino protease [Paraliobacillus quinghaiensis]